jgi:hypothetical protein
MPDEIDLAAKRAELIAELGLSIECAFVPFSQSRNAKEKHPSLNWRVTLKREDREILTTDYMQGSAHCPSYSQRESFRPSVDYAKAIEAECETGRSAKRFRERIAAPKIADVLYSLFADSDVLDYDSFEDWAPNLGYDPDSRSAEKIYRACLGHALALRNGIGESKLAELREAFLDY